MVGLVRSTQVRLVQGTAVQIFEFRSGRSGHIKWVRSGRESAGQFRLSQVKFVRTSQVRSVRLVKFR